jgi:hypothetical protein
MITIISNKINTLNQISYNNFLQNIEIHQLLCSCGLSGCLIKHGYYIRSIKTSCGIIPLSILRVKCKHCGKTHAIFPFLIVPYSNILLDTHLSIITTYISKSSFEPIMMDNEYIDESNIKYIIRQFLRYWKERIAAFEFSVFDSPDILSNQCLNTFKRQFMQIKHTTNILFAKPT